LHVDDDEHGIVPIEQGHPEIIHHRDVLFARCAPGMVGGANDDAKQPFGNRREPKPTSASSPTRERRRLP
jgi:hypothetical protein